MEKLVGEYLDSMVGDYTTLTVSKQQSHYGIKGLSPFVYLNEYYVNGVKVGSRNTGINKISMNRELYNSTRKLFGLSHKDTSLYFNRWLNKIPVDGE